MEKYCELPWLKNYAFQVVICLKISIFPQPIIKIFYTGKWKVVFAILKSTLLRYNLHMAKHTHFKCTLQYALTNLYTCITTSTIKRKIFITLNVPLSPTQVIPIPILSTWKSLVSFVLLYIIYAVYQVSHEWNCTVCTPLWPNSVMFLCVSVVYYFFIAE